MYTLIHYILYTFIYIKNATKKYKLQTVNKKVKIVTNVFIYLYLFIYLFIYLVI